ncbi:unnamed protein product [Parnassius apollo]|uniref:(apollo) hypothetical protein n=1 Tax=Parnassius apollo TaxID=110799 RepID=A0A8S3X5K5_PARAO|nr:unnamed protein product [Parnassius apollo]
MSFFFPNYNAIPNEAVATSMVSESTNEDLNKENNAPQLSYSGVENILKIPQAVSKGTNEDLNKEKNAPELSCSGVENILKILQIPQAVSEGTNEDLNKEKKAPELNYSGIENILKILQKQRKEGRKCPKGKEKRGQVSGPVENVKPKNINICGTCGGDFKNDVKAKNGKE